MLIQNYLPQIHKTINHELFVWGDTIASWPTIKYWQFTLPTKPLSEINATTPEELQYLFDEQLAHIKKEASILQEYHLLSKKSYEITIKQYTDLYVLEEHNSTSTTTQTSIQQPAKAFAFRKEELMSYVTKTYNQTSTLLTDNQPKPKLTTTQTTDPSIPTQTISLEAIRKITDYSFTPFIRHLNKRVYIEWQEDLFSLAHDTVNNKEIIVNWSRQMGKSKCTAQLLVESSFLPSHHALVAAPSQALTNLIKNYIDEYISAFDDSLFTVKAKENFIQNNFSWSRIHFLTLKDEGKRTLGLTLSRIIVDESQLVDPATILEALKPTLLTTSGQMILLGTAIADTSSYFYWQIMANKKWDDSVKVITVSADNNPLIPDKEREQIKKDLENPIKRASVLRQYYNTFWWDDWKLFIPNIIQSYDYNPNATLIIALDPARKSDRSWFSIHQIIENKIVTVYAWEVPASHKWDWSLQCQFMLQKKNEYQNKYKRIITVIDVSWVGDWVATIFEKWWYRIDYKIRYTAWDSYSIDKKEQNTFKVGKTTLLNNCLDLMWSDVLELFDDDTKLLQEELSYIEADFDNFWKTKMKSKFFDDISNSLLIALFISTKLGIHMRPVSELWTKTERSKFIKELEMYYWDNRKNKRNMNVAQTNYW